MNINIKVIVALLCNVLTILIVARALMTWFPIRHDNPFEVFLNRVTEPFLAPIRRVIPHIGMIDIAPLVAVLVLQLILTLVSR